jgi:hypothetical protein
MPVLKHDLQSLHDAMREILENAKKKLVCPLCLTSYSRADAAFGHCWKKGEEKKDMNEREKMRSKIHRIPRIQASNATAELNTETISGETSQV